LKQNVVTPSPSPTTLETGRGIYVLKGAAPLERSTGWVVLTLSFERADGIEKVAFRCRIATVLLHSAASDSGSDSCERLMMTLRPWLAREFEHTREAALKTIRTEHHLLEISFDVTNPGPVA